MFLSEKLAVLKSALAVALGIGMTILLLFGQNCGGIRLMRGKGQLSSSGLGATSTIVYKALNPPEREKRPLRILFLIDQSWSMVAQPCRGDLDSSFAQDDPDPCLPDPGNDFNGMRFEAVKKLLKQLQYDSNDPSYDVKAAVIPFTGRPSASYSNSAFYPLNATHDDIQAPPDENTIANLINEHNMAKGKFEISSYPMNRTSLSNALEAAASLTQKEMAILKADSSLNQARFQVVILTDGLMRGRFEDIKTAMNFYSLQRVLPPLPAGYVCGGDNCKGPFDCASSVVNWNPGIDRFNECPYLWQQLQYTFGNMIDATATGVSDKIFRLIAVFRAAGIHVPGIEILRIATPFLPNASNVEALQFMNDLRRLSGVPYHDLISASELPIDLGLRLRSSVAKSYRLKSLVVRNLNAKIDENGALRTDSDGDGIPDDDETSAAQTARSNGVCLDSITQSVGCLTDQNICKAEVDVDRDGLNDCEEKTLTSDRIFFDTDHDGIPDLLDLVYGGSPIRDDSHTDTNGSGISDLSKFMKGLSPNSPLNVDPKFVTDYTLSVEGTQKVKNASGDEIVVEKYAIQIKNIPLVNTLEVQPDPNTFDGNPGKKIDPATLFGPTGHARGINQILIYGEVQAVDAPETSFWILQKIEVLFGDNVQFDIDPQTFKEIYF